MLAFIEVREKTTIPEIGMSRNSVLEHQFHLELVSAVVTSLPHVRDQRGSTVAVGTKESAPAHL